MDTADSSKVNISYSSAAQSRWTISETITKNISESRNPPQFASFYWDSKLMPFLNNQNEKQGRLGVTVGNSQEIKVLGIPHNAPEMNKKGCEVICELTMNLFEKWKFAEDIVSLVFDMGASNNEYVSAACGCVQQLLLCSF